MIKVKSENIEVFVDYSIFKTNGLCFTYTTGHPFSPTLSDASYYCNTCQISGNFVRVKQTTSINSLSITDIKVKGTLIKYSGIIIFTYIKM